MYNLSHQPIIRQSMLGVLCALSVLTAPGVQADDVNTFTNTNSVNVPAVGTVTLIQGAIFTPAGRELVIHYFAECEVNGAGAARFIDYDIEVSSNGGAFVAVPPTNVADSALCQGNEDDVSVGTVVARPVPGGNHTIRVRGRMAGGGNAVGNVDDQSLVIEEEAP